MQHLQNGLPGKPRSQHLQNAPLSVIASPGLMKSHYAPNTPLQVLSKRFSELSSSDLQNLKLPIEIALLCLQTDPTQARMTFETLGHHVKIAAFLGNSETEAAKNLFKTLRELDHVGTGVILSEPCPSQTGLWLAIEDRIKRAMSPLNLL